MQHSPSNLEIPQDKPFSNDCLERKGIAESLSTLVSTTNQPFVLGIDAPFGTGKTTFIKMWKQSLINESYKVVYMNAWETDFTSNPIVTLIAEMAMQLGMKAGAPSAGWSGVIKNADVISANTRLSCGHNGDGSSSSGFVEQMESYHKTRESISAFRKSMEILAKELDDKSKLPVIVVIDELDRCQPHYAVQMLENIKHLFSVNNFFFVLGIDRKQMQTLVSSVYGSGFDTDSYLRRIIDVDYKLFEPSAEAFGRFLYHRYRLEEVSVFSESETNGGKTLVDTSAALSKALGLSLRLQEKCFSHYNAIIRSIGQENGYYPVLLATLVTLQLRNHELYERYVTGRTDSRRIADFLESETSNNDRKMDEQALRDIMIWLRRGRSEKVGNELIVDFLAPKLAMASSFSG